MAHAGSPHMAAFGAAIGDVIGGPADVLRFEVVVLRSAVRLRPQSWWRRRTTALGRHSDRHRHAALADHAGQRIDVRLGAGQCAHVRARPTVGDRQRAPVEAIVGPQPADHAPVGRHHLDRGAVGTEVGGDGRDGPPPSPTRAPRRRPRCRAAGSSSSAADGGARGPAAPDRRRRPPAFLGPASRAPPAAGPSTALGPGATLPRAAPARAPIRSPDPTPPPPRASRAGDPPRPHCAPEGAAGVARRSHPTTVTPRGRADVPRRSASEPTIHHTGRRSATGSTIAGVYCAATLNW